MQDCPHQRLLAVDTPDYAIEGAYLCLDCGDYFDLRLLNTWRLTPKDWVTTAQAMLRAAAEREAILAVHKEGGA